MGGDRDLSRGPASWTVVGASVRGTGHEKQNIPCQDAHAYHLAAAGAVLIAVSDGAGSAERSQEGADRAVKSAVQFLTNQLSNGRPPTPRKWGALLLDAFHRTREDVLALSHHDPSQARQFACTLTLVIADQDWLVTGQIGDGLAVARTSDDHLHIVAAPQRGEYANTTHFLTGQNAPDHFLGRVYHQGSDIRPVRALAVMTDGLTGLAVERASGRAHRPFFEPLLAFPQAMSTEEQGVEDLSQFLGSDRVNARTDDDKTLVLAARTPGH